MQYVHNIYAEHKSGGGNWLLVHIMYHNVVLLMKEHILFAFQDSLVCIYLKKSAKKSTTDK